MEENSEIKNSLTIGERLFKFSIPTPWDGCAIFNMETAYKIPFGFGSIFGIDSAKQVMPPKELQVFQKLCLKYIHEVKEGTSIPVIDEDGNIGIIGATGPMLVKLTCQYMLFFIQYWQDESPSISD